MTKKELLKVLSDRYVKASHEFIEAPIDTPAATRTHAQMHLLAEVLDMVLTLPKDAPEPEPPKKARRINLTNKDGYWYWEIWQEEEPGSWGKVFSMSFGYAVIDEAAQVARQWREKNP